MPAPQRNSIPPLAAFFDLFNHRLISLFYRLGQVPSLSAWDRADRATGQGGVFPGRPAIARDPRAGPRRGRGMLLYAGLFASRHRHAAGLEEVVKGYFDEPVEVVQFVGRWLSLGSGDRSRLGARGVNNQLRVNLSRRQPGLDERGKFRLRVGPMTYERYPEFLPGRPAFQALVKMARLTSGPNMNSTSSSSFRPVTSPLAASGPPQPHLQVRRTSWLMSRQAKHDVDNMIFPSGV